MRQDTHHDRRSLLKRLGMAITLLGLDASPASARSSKAAAAYRDSPKGGQSCANCSWYSSGGRCEVVSGKVSPRGWCALWG